MYQYTPKIPNLSIGSGFLFVFEVVFGIVSGMWYNLSDKQRATYNRQKAINLLEKITKNLFRMFRDEESTQEQIVERFFFLKEQLDAVYGDNTTGEIALNADYHREMKTYIDTIASTFSGNFTLDDIRSENMTKLNRLQKIKNTSGYTRAKDKKKKARKTYRAEDFID